MRRPHSPATILTVALCASLVTTACTEVDTDVEEEGPLSAPTAMDMHADCMQTTFTDVQRVANSTPHKYGGGVLCAVPLGLDTVQDTTYDTDTVAVAFIDVIEEGTYPDDGVVLGRNCYYIGPKNPGTGNAPTDKLQAFVSVVPISGNACPPFTATGAKPMKVSTSAEAHPDSVPPVVRIDQSANPSGKRQIVLGLKCLPGVWCEIHRTGNGSPASKGANALRRVKGWYDEQRLAIDTLGGPPFGLKPGGVNARIYPSNGLAAVLASPTPFQTWTEAAVIHFDTSSDATVAQVFATYRTKWGLDSLKRDLTAADTIVVELIRRAPGDSLMYSARFRVGAFTGDLRRVAYTPDTLEVSHFKSRNIRMPINVAAARWGWVADDESAWVRCYAGCCEVTSTEDPPPGPAPAAKTES